MWIFGTVWMKTDIVSELLEGFSFQLKSSFTNDFQSWSDIESAGSQLSKPGSLSSGANTLQPPVHTQDFSISNILLCVWDDCGILNSFTISKPPCSYLERSVTANQIAFLIFFLLILQIISHQLQDYLQDKD